MPTLVRANLSKSEFLDAVGTSTAVNTGFDVESPAVLPLGGGAAVPDACDPCIGVDRVLVRLLTDPAKRDAVYKVILLVVFFDLLGPLVLATGEAGLVGASALPPQVFEGQSFTSNPFPGLAMNKAVLSSATALGTSASALLIVPLSDTLGRKSILLLFLFGGAIIYAVLMVVGDVTITGSFAYYG
jgi:hypothetical protein